MKMTVAQVEIAIREGRLAPDTTVYAVIEHEPTPDRAGRGDAHVEALRADAVQIPECYEVATSQYEAEELIADAYFADPTPCGCGCGRTSGAHRYADALGVKARRAASNAMDREREDARRYEEMWG